VFAPGAVAWRKKFVQSNAGNDAKLAPKRVKGIIVERTGTNTYKFRDAHNGKEAIYSVDDLYPD
jgi:uncharacterized protein YdeI (BOF family)